MKVCLIGVQPKGLGPPHLDKTCLLGSRIDLEADIFKISAPPLGLDILSPCILSNLPMEKASKKG